MFMLILLTLGRRLQQRCSDLAGASAKIKLLTSFISIPCS